MTLQTKIFLKENEKKALLKLKNVLLERYNLLNYRLYGSKVKGINTPGSDIDLMIELAEITPEIEKEIDEIVFEVNLEFNCLISVVLFSEKEIKHGPLSESPLYKVIQREGVSI